MTKGCRAFLIAGSGKPRRGHEKRCGSPEQRRGHEKHARAGGNEPGTTRGPEFSARNSCTNLDSSSKTVLETQRTEKKAFRAGADSAQSARPGGTEPGTTRFRDGRATARPPAPRRGPAAPALQPRPRGLDLESAQVSVVQKMRFWPRTWI